MSDNLLPGRRPDVALPEAAQPDGPLSLRLVTEADWEACCGRRLEMLADAPDCCWATLADVEHCTEQTWRERASGPQTHLQALLDGEPGGALSIDWIGCTEVMLLDEDTVNIVSVETGRRSPDPRRPRLQEVE